MKIGLLSLVLRGNYGGILQSYALQTVLERMGYDVFVLTRNRNIHVGPISLLLSWTKSVVQIFGGKKISFFNPWRQNRELSKREQYTRAFTRKYIHTHVVKKLTKGLLNDVDAVIVGSDQVWRPRYFKKQWGTDISKAFLDFQEQPDIKRIAYAASFGTDKWEYDETETKRCRILIKKFNAVSVREQSGIELCKKYLEREDVKWVVDPTMLLSQEDYERLIPRDVKAPGDVMCYVLDVNPTVSSVIKRIAEEGKYKVFYANKSVSDTSVPATARILPPVEQWLAGLRDAKIVITDSFHACVFSILFHKPFIVIGNKDRGYSRFESLLSRFGLEYRLIENATQVDESMFTPISNEVYKKLEEYRKDSMNFLIKTLNC